MDIIFQSGEFYSTGTDWTSVITTIISGLTGAIVSGLIAVWIFQKGIKIQRENEERKENDRIDDIKDFYLHTIKSKLKPIDNQIKHNSQLISQLKLKQAANFVYKFNPDLHFDELKGIDQKDIFIIFLHKGNSIPENGSEKYLGIVRSIRVLEILSNDSKETLKYLDVKYQDYQKKFGVTTSKIQKLIQRYTHSNDVNNIKLEKDPFIFSIWEKIVEWQKIKNVDNKDPYIVNERYLQPLRKICAEHHTDTRKPEILDLILDAQHYFEQLDNIKCQLRERIIRNTRLLISIKIKIEDF